jgi:hypothetical protein
MDVHSGITQPPEAPRQIFKSGQGGGGGGKKFSNPIYWKKGFKKFSGLWQLKKSLKNFFPIHVYLKRGLSLIPAFQGHAPVANFWAFYNWAQGQFAQCTSENFMFYFIL